MILCKSRHLSTVVFNDDEASGYGTLTEQALSAQAEYEATPSDSNTSTFCRGES